MAGDMATGTDDVCRAAAGLAVVGDTATGTNEDRVTMFVLSHTGAPVVTKIDDGRSQQKCGL